MEKSSFEVEKNRRKHRKSFAYLLIFDMPFLKTLGISVTKKTEAKLTSEQL